MASLQFEVNIAIEYSKTVANDSSCSRLVLKKQDSDSLGLLSHLAHLI